MPDELKSGYYLNMSQAQNERLVVLSESCVALMAAIFKIQRYGFDENDPLWADLIPTNRVAMIKEVGRFMFALSLCINAGDLGNTDGDDCTAEMNRLIVQAKKGEGPPLIYQKSIVERLDID